MPYGQSFNSDVNYNLSVVFPSAQPISAASLPLPAGASTSAKQPALGIAGTASADVITIQGIASMTPIQVTISLSGTATQTSVAASASSVTVLASNAARKGAMFYNDGLAVAKVLFGATASSTAFSVLLAPNSGWEMDSVLYTGNIAGIWSSATGSMRVTEFT